MKILDFEYNFYVNKTYLSIVIPSYDEIANLRKGVLEKIAVFLSKKKYQYEVIVIDDGSKDGSPEFVKRFIKHNPNFSLIENSHLGKAGAVTKGMLLAKGEYVLFTDMDQATPIEEIDNLMPYFGEKYDIVIGSRKSKRQGAPWTRLVMAKSMIALRSLIVGLNNISDTQCGFKVFRRDVSKSLFTKINNLHHGFNKANGSNVTAGFDVELLYLARKIGYKIKEAPVEWHYVETRRVNPLKDSIEGLRELFQIKLNGLKGLYD